MDKVYMQKTKLGILINVSAVTGIAVSFWRDGKIRGEIYCRPTPSSMMRLIRFMSQYEERIVVYPSFNMFDIKLDLSDIPKLMPVEDALEIVYDLALGNALDHKFLGDDHPLYEEASRQQEALNTVHDFMLNVVSEGRI